MDSYRKWSNGKYQLDLDKEAYDANKRALQYYGHDQFTYSHEKHHMWNTYWKIYEAPFAHGYPKTTYL